jgi:hypothetical protein
MNYLKAIINSRMLVSNGQNLINYPVNITKTDYLDLSSSYIELEVSNIVQDDGVEELHCVLLNEYVLAINIYYKSILNNFLIFLKL